MDIYRRIVTEILPDRLQRVPIPASFTGIFKLSVGELASVAVFTGISGFVAYSVFTTCRLQLAKHAKLSGLVGIGGGGGGSCVGKGTLVNIGVRKDEAKVVDNLSADDIGEKVAMCRCWRSKKFPYCDGSHNQHNKDTGDNVGPLLVKK